MSHFDGFAPTYTFQLRIERSDRVILNTTIVAKANADEIAKAKKNVQRLLNEYAPTIKAPESVPAQPPEEAALALPDPEPAPEAPVPVPERKPEGAKGLLRLHCSNCGNSFGTFLREYQSEITCRCGHHIDLTIPLARYRFTCPHCGKESWGKTNLEDPEITVRCTCGTDVEMRWVPKVKEYQN